jgi:hypothetical protein
MTFPIPFFHPAGYWDYLVLWCKGDSFVDSSKYNTTITNNSASSDGTYYIGDGSTSFETTDNSSNFVLFNTLFTIEFYLKRKSDAYGAILGKTRLDDISTSAARYWLISMGTSGPLKFSYNDGGGAKNVNGTIIPADGTEHFCKFTYDGTDLKYYLDGSLDFTQAISPFTDDTVKLGIMAEDSYPGVPFLGYGSTATDYRGLLRDLKIYRGIVIP